MSTVAVIRSRHPDVSERTMRRIQRESSEIGLAHIQKSFLQKHFKRSAVSTYPEQYGMLSDKLRRRRDKQPLVVSGLTRQIALSGSPSFTGRGDRRKMIIRGLPRYFYMNRNYKPGNFHKQQALEAVTDGEIEEIVKIIDGELGKRLAATI